MQIKFLWDNLISVGIFKVLSKPSLYELGVKWEAYYLNLIFLEILT